jgi:hypothetical protein
MSHASQMASIEVSLSTTPRRKKGGSISGGVTSPAGHRNRDHYKELDALRVALRDKENIIQTWVIVRIFEVRNRGILAIDWSSLVTSRLSRLLVLRLEAQDAIDVDESCDSPWG